MNPEVMGLEVRIAELLGKSDELSRLKLDIIRVLTIFNGGYLRRLR